MKSSESLYNKLKSVGMVTTEFEFYEPKLTVIWKENHKIAGTGKQQSPTIPPHCN